MTHRPFSALNSLIPSAGPQIWMTSSLVSFSRSAPEAQKQGFTNATETPFSISASFLSLVSFKKQLYETPSLINNESVLRSYVTWEIGEEPTELWEAVSVKPLLGILWCCCG